MGMGFITNSPGVTGTSFAAPLVAGCLAIKKKIYPHFTIDQLINSVHDDSGHLKNNMANEYFSFGYLKRPQFD